jgi:hypothetical protein
MNIILTRRPEFVCLLGNRDDKKAGVKILDAFLCFAEGELKPILLAADSNFFSIKWQSHYAVTHTYIKNFTTVYGARNLFMDNASLRSNRERLLNETVKNSYFVCSALQIYCSFIATIGRICFAIETVFDTTLKNI